MPPNLSNRNHWSTRVTPRDLFHKEEKLKTLSFHLIEDIKGVRVSPIKHNIIASLPNAPKGKEKLGAEVLGANMVKSSYV